MRVLNPVYGYPVLYAVADEVNNYAAALYMLSEKTLLAHQSVYPPFGAYLQVPFMFLTYLLSRILSLVASYDDFVLYLFTHTGAMLFISRLFSAVFGIATVYLLYRLTKELFPKKPKIAWWSAFLLTTSINHVIISNFGRPWSPAIFFYLLSARYFFRSINVPKDRWKNICLGSICAVLTEGFLQIGFFAWLLFGCLLLKDRLSRLILRTHVVLITSSFLFYGVATELLHKLKILQAMTDSFVAPIKFGNIMGILNYIYHHNTLGYFVYQALTTEPIIIIGFSLSIIWVHKRFKDSLGVLFFSLIYIAILAYGNRHAARYLIPILIVMIPYASWFIVYFFERIQSKQLRIFLFIFLLVTSLSMPIRWNYLVLQTPTFIQVADYIKEHIPPEVSIAATTRRYSIFEPGIKAILAMQKLHPTYYRQLQSQLKEEYASDTRNIYYLDQLGWDASTNVYSLAKEYQIKYIISYAFHLNHTLISSGTQFRRIALFSPAENPGTLDVSDMTIDAVWVPLPILLWHINRPGPYVEIWEVL